MCGLDWIGCFCQPLFRDRQKRKIEIISQIYTISEIITCSWTLYLERSTQRVLVRGLVTYCLSCVTRFVSQSVRGIKEGRKLIFLLRSVPRSVDHIHETHMCNRQWS